jgi:hypothetical protein
MTIYLKVRKSDGAVLEEKNLTNPVRDLSKPAVWLPLIEDDTQPDGVDLNHHKVANAFVMPDFSGDLSNAVVTRVLKKIDLSNIEKLARLDAALTEKLLNGETLTSEEIAQRKSLAAE